MSDTPNSVEVKTEKPITKLLLFVSSADQSSFTRNRIGNLSDLIQRLNYGFVVQMPTVHCVKDEEEEIKIEPKFETYVNWRGKERQREIYQPPPPKSNCPYSHYLEFVKPLTDEELKFWRIFKLGYLCREFNPEGLWRNRR